MFMEEIQKVLAKMGMHFGKSKIQLKVNRIRDQSMKSANCGYFSMKFLVNRLHGESFAKASGFDDFWGGVRQKEKHIDKWKTKIEKFKHL